MKLIHICKSLILCALAVGCQTKEAPKLILSHDIMPLRMVSNPDTFFTTDLGIYNGIATVSASGAEVSRLGNDQLVLKTNEDIGFASLTFSDDQGRTGSAVVFPTTKKSFTLCYPDSNKEAESVGLKGEMTNWVVNQCKFDSENGCWAFKFDCTPGRYQYVFVVDGKETVDPVNEKTVTSDLGSTNSLFDYPLPKDEEVCQLRATSAENGQLVISNFSANVDQILALAGNAIIPIVRGEDQFTISLDDIPSGATSLRVYASTGAFLSNDLYIPLKDNTVVRAAEDLERTDWHSQVMYFTLMDRFNNGDTSNDKKVDDPRVLDKCNYQGGDLKGITQKIKEGYFQDLGINTIWLSPITQNPEGAYQEFPAPHRWYSGYHGYWPEQSNVVDHRFGDEAALKELVETAHGEGINILLDFICNHVHKNHKIYQENPDWATDLYLEDSTVNIRIWEEQRLTTWFDDFLPSLDFSKPEVIEMQADSAFFWLKEFGLDGYRHDATKHVPKPFWRRLTQMVREEVIEAEGRPIFQIGETFGSRSLIASYLGSGLLDAQFDFTLYFELRNILLDDNMPFSDFATNLKQSLDNFGHHHLMGNITGNHDIPRFISLAGGDLKLNESDREAGFTRDIGVGEPVGYEKLKLLHAILNAIPGIPVIYYGDEIGMPGAGDPDNRRMMRFDGWNDKETDVQAAVDKLVEWRRTKLPLIYGTTEVLEADEKRLVIKRSYFNEHVVIVLNKNNQESIFTLELPEERETLLNHEITQNKEAPTSALVIPSYGFEYIYYED